MTNFTLLQNTFLINCLIIGTIKTFMGVKLKRRQAKMKINKFIKKASEPKKAYKNYSK